MKLRWEKIKTQQIETENSSRAMILLQQQQQQVNAKFQLQHQQKDDNNKTWFYKLSWNILRSDDFLHILYTIIFHILQKLTSVFKNCFSLQRQ